MANKARPTPESAWVALVWLLSVPFSVIVGVIVLLGLEYAFTVEVTDDLLAWVLVVVWVLLCAIWTVPRTVKWLSSVWGNPEDWHGGKVIMVWLGWFLACLGFVGVIGAIDGPSPEGAMELLLAVGIVWLFIGAPWVIPITWQWLSGKEGR